MVRTSDIIYDGSAAVSQKEHRTCYAPFIRDTFQKYKRFREFESLRAVYTKICSACFMNEAGVLN